MNHVTQDRHWTMERTHMSDLFTKSGATAKCLGVTKSGDPRYPLFLAADTPLIDWKMPAY